MLDRVGRSPRERVVALIDGLLPPGAPRPAPADERPLAAFGLTSFDVVNLMLAVEGEFDVTIPQPEIVPENFRTLGAIELLLAKLGAAG
ncbi:MAG TPA: phosphopantetheine-binding protein [Hyphomicrobiales bacterium]|nr:phosphopantetheine-binding protein [Hyphomicrobiales bacterium]